MKNFENPIFLKETMRFFLATLIFICSTFNLIAQDCSNSNNDANSLGSGGTSGKEPMSIIVPNAQSEVYFANINVPSFRDMLGVNIGIGQGTQLGNLNGTGIGGFSKNITAIFSHLRLYTASNKDFFHSNTTNPPARSRTEQIPNGNTFLPDGKSNLRLLLDADGMTSGPIGPTTLDGKSFVFPKINSSGEVELVTEPTTNFPNAPSNHYINYMNTNYMPGLAAANHLGKPVTITLNIVADLFSESSLYGFPYGWFRQDGTYKDWGNDLADVKKHAKAYAMMLARTYAPKAADCSSCVRIADIIEIGNEPYGYFYDASNYQAIVEGFIEGINSYYASDQSRKIKLLAGAFQAHHAENPSTVPSNSPVGNDWKDYMNTRIPSSAKCDLIGINTHPYSFEFSNNYSLTAYPEKVVTSGGSVTAGNNFLRIRNAWQWLKDNPMAKSGIYASEFGWDSEVCTRDGFTYPAVGAITQSIYVMRNLLMMGRYGVQKATLYEAINDGSVCGYAYHKSGVWDESNQPKYIFKALDKFMEKIGSSKFHFALREDNNGVFSYILEENGQPKYMVAWRAMDINNASNSQSLQQLISGKESNEAINITLNGTTFLPDVSQSWWQLDGENNTPITPSVYNPSSGVFKLSPVPIVIPIVALCSANTFTPSTVTGTKTLATGTTEVSQNDITVASNATLTINGTLIMAAGKSIVVQPNGTLNVDGGTITNACGDMWNGIDAFSGNITLNNAKIEHALDGITSNGGTVISATNTVFLNNRRDIEFLDKPLTPNTTFVLCTFKVDNAYRGSEIRSRMTLWNSQGVKVEGGTFLNEYPSPLNLSSNFEYDWQGIYAVASTIEVDK